MLNLYRLGFRCPHRNIGGHAASGSLQSKVMCLLEFPARSHLKAKALTPSSRPRESCKELLRRNSVRVSQTESFLLDREDSL
jgi:hypothetical protein